jgi:hypothetical protein
MSNPNHSVHEMPRNVFHEEDLIESDVELLAILTSRTPSNLHDLFIHHLTNLIKATTRTVEYKTASRIELHVSRNSGSPQLPMEKDVELRDFLQKMASSMAVISKHKSGM